MLLQPCTKAADVQQISTYFPRVIYLASSLAECSDGRVEGKKRPFRSPILSNVLEPFKSAVRPLSKDNGPSCSGCKAGWGYADQASHFIFRVISHWTVHETEGTKCFFVVGALLGCKKWGCRSKERSMILDKDAALHQRRSTADGEMGLPPVLGSTCWGQCSVYFCGILERLPFRDHSALESGVQSAPK